LKTGFKEFETAASTMAEVQKEKFLKKKERQACWDARDTLWGCMDKVKDEDDAGKVCRQARDLYEKLCPQSWVVHFDRKYQFEKFKHAVQRDGFQKTDENYIVKPPVIKSQS